MLMVAEKGTLYNNSIDVYITQSTVNWIKDFNAESNSSLEKCNLMQFSV